MPQSRNRNASFCNFMGTMRHGHCVEVLHLLLLEMLRGVLHIPAAHGSLCWLMTHHALTDLTECHQLLLYSHPSVFAMHALLNPWCPHLPFPPITISVEMWLTWYLIYSNCWWIVVVICIFSLCYLKNEDQVEVVDPVMTNYSLQGIFFSPCSC